MELSRDKGLPVLFVVWTSLLISLKFTLMEDALRDLFSTGIM